MATNLFIVVLLLIANAFFVAAEFALVKVKSFRVDARAEAGSRTAQLSQRIHRKLESYLAACQLGITMASLGLGWVGEPAVAALLKPLLRPLHLAAHTEHTIAFITGFIIFSSLHIVVGEQVPKTFAIRKPEPVSMWVAYPLHFFYCMVFPLNWMLNASSRTILRWCGVEEASHTEILSDDEIRGLIEVSEEHGTMETAKAAMLHNLFDFATRTVEEIMVPRGKVAAIDLEAPWEKQRAVLSRIEHSRFPVLQGGDQHLKGILLAKDLYNEILNVDVDLQGKLEGLVREPLVIPETQKIGSLFERMRTEHQHMAVVIDEYGAFAGIVTMEDLLEEIVGEIADELDQDQTGEVLTRMEDYWQTEGWTQLSDISRALDLSFHEVDANTVSGLFMVRLGRVPEEGDRVTEQDYEFTIESMTGRRVNIATIRHLAPPEPTGPEPDPVNPG